MDQLTKGAYAKGNRIQLVFFLNGQRFRPELDIVPTEKSLRQAAKRLVEIKQRIKLGTFDFAAEFPDFRRLAVVAPVAVAANAQTLNDVVREYLVFCDSEVKLGQMAPVSVKTARNVLAHRWEAGVDADLKPISGFGQRVFTSITYPQLEAQMRKLSDCKVKTINNSMHLIKAVFKRGYKLLGRMQENPAIHLEALTVPQAQKTQAQPFTVSQVRQALDLFAAKGGERSKLFAEVGFFVGMRPSEQIALELADVNLDAGTILVHQGRVDGAMKDSTKTSVARTVHLNPRALAAFRAQLALRAQLVLAGGPVAEQLRKHSRVFFGQRGGEIMNVVMPWSEWKAALKGSEMANSVPYHARHTSVTWNLILGTSMPVVAQQHGHGVEIMLKNYTSVVAAMRGDKPEAVLAQIKDAMQLASNVVEMKKAA